MVFRLIANLILIFKNFFSDLADDLVKKLPNSKNIFGTDSVKAYYKKIVPQDKNFSLVHVTKEYTEKLLSSINISKAVGIDNISGRFLKDRASKLQSRS